VELVPSCATVAEYRKRALSQIKAGLAKNWLFLYRLDLATFGWERYKLPRVRLNGRSTLQANAPASWTGGHSAAGLLASADF